MIADNSSLTIEGAWQIARALLLAVSVDRDVWPLHVAPVEMVDGNMVIGDGQVMIAETVTFPRPGETEQAIAVVHRVGTDHAQMNTFTEVAPFVDFLRSVLEQLPVDVPPEDVTYLSLYPAGSRVARVHRHSWGR